jgi:tetratricopeptide (TPR) repeat protein
MTQYHCPALVDCPRADAREIFDLPTGDDNKCPTCQTPLVVPGENAVDQPGGNKKLPLLVSGALVLIAVAAGEWYLSHKSAPAPVAAAAAAAPIAPLAPVPAAVAAPVAAPATNGMTPDSAETAALKRRGESQLVAGEASAAELSASKAASNELIKLAVSKLAQGKLDDAEKDLLAAKDKDPRQSLVNYNLGVLRLRQNRTDEALKEFEASFMKGFPYFDKLEQDSDLAPIRKDPRFVTLLKRYQPAK